MYTWYCSQGYYHTVIHGVHTPFWLTLTRMQPGDGVLARGECLHVGMQLITQMNVSNVGTLNACFECFNKIVIAFIHTSTLTSPPNLALARIHHHTPSQLNPTPKHTNTYKHKYTYTLKHTPERTAPAVFAACTPRPLHFQAAASVEAAAAGCRPQHSLSSLLPLCIQSGKSTCLSILPYSFSCVCVCACVFAHMLPTHFKDKRRQGVLVVWAMPVKCNTQGLTI